MASTSPQRTTLRDVAAASGVSTATVSFVLNDAPDQSISAATRERVLKAADELGYRLNGVAKALAEGSSRIVVLNTDSRLPGNYARSYIAGLDGELSRHGYVLLVRHDTSLVDDDRVLAAIKPKAVLHFGSPYRDGRELEDAGGGWRDGLAAHSAMQIRYLAEHGHREIVLAVPALDAPLVAVRLRFSNETAASLGIAPIEVLAVPATRPGTCDAVAALRRDRPRVTAVAALDDDCALRVLGAMGDCGLVAPDDLAVIGYDDSGYGEFSRPALTTIHIDAEAHGRISAREALGLDHSDLELTPGAVLVRASA